MHSTAGWLAMLQSVVWQRDVNQQMIAYRDGWRFSGGAFLTRLQLLPLEWQRVIPPAADFMRAQYGEDSWLNVGYSGWSGRAVIQLDVMRVTILAQTPWLMLFRMSGEPFLCLDPQTHPVNAHHMQGQPGLQVLAQGERCHFAMQICVE